MEKSFELLNPQTGDVLGIYNNRQPRQAAMKAASKGVTDIILRERDSGNETKLAKLHRFTGAVKSGKWRLPLPGWKVTSEAERTGKKIPQELNKKGKEAELEKAGYECPVLNKPHVKKVKTYNIPRVKGADLHEEVKKFVKTLDKPT